MTEDQIEKHFDAIYLHYEHGELAPFGVSLKGSVRKTIGRVWVDTDEGLVAQSI